MNRLNTTAMFAAVLLGALMFPPQSEAGKVRYEQCFTSLGNKTDGIKATLQAGGLFYSWKGSLVNETVATNFKKCEATAAIFTGSSVAGVNSIVPEPSSFALLAIAVLALSAVHWSRVIS